MKDLHKSDINRSTSIPEYLKTLISAYIESYKTVYHEEFKAFREGLKQKSTHTDFGEFKKNGLLKNNDYLIGELVEYPETLHFILQKNLSSEEFALFNSLGGKQWLRKAHPEFKPERV